jgi:hypothetical protein
VVGVEGCKRLVEGAPLIEAATSANDDFHAQRIACSALSHKGFLLCSQTCKAA